MVKIMMNKVEKMHFIIRENLSEEHYFQSLLLEASALKLISSEETDKIKLQSIQLVAKLVERYTRGKSSSVSVEVAQNIFRSSLYTVGVFLKSLPDADLALTALREKPLQELFEQGNTIILNQVRSAKRLLGTVKANSIDTDNIAYNATVNEGLGCFFISYDATFAAHDTPGSIDYPLNCDKMNLVGIEYITKYLQTLYLENQFCMRFNSHKISCLLRGFDSNYQDLLINIFEQMLINALGCVLRNKNVLMLNMEPIDRQRLQKELENLSNVELIAVLQDASARLSAQLHIPSGLMQKHIAGAVQVFAIRLKDALEKHQLDCVFVSLKGTQAKQAIKFSDGEKMDDELFSKVTEDIKECRFAEDKIAIIKRDIHSILDLIDIFEGDYIFGDEFTLVFQTLEDIELALLLKKLPEYMAASGNPFTETEKEWEIKFTEYLKLLDAGRSNSIRELAERIN